MKKIVFLIFSLVLSSNFIFANEQIDISSLNKALETEMPSDEQIIQMLEKLNLEGEQQEMLFKETKAKLEQMYSTKDINVLLNLYEPYVEKEQKNLQIERPQKRQKPIE